MAIVILCGVGMGINWVFQHRYAVDYDLISIAPDDTVTLKITNKSYTVWEKREGITLTCAMFADDWQSASNRVNVPLDTTLSPGQSCQISIKLPQNNQKEEYPKCLIGIEGQ